MLKLNIYVLVISFYWFLHNMKCICNHVLNSMKFYCQKDNSFYQIKYNICFKILKLKHLWILDGI